MNFNTSGIFRDGRKEIILIVLSLAIAVLVFLPWQIYIFQAFPVESTFEAQWNSRHITEALENQAGPWYYYILQMPLQFGKICASLIPLGLFSLFAFSRNRLLLVALLFCLIVPYAFFSIIVQTRMPSYVYMSHFIIWLSFGLLVLGLSELPPINKDFKFKAIIQTSFLLSSPCFSFSRFMIFFPMIFCNKLLEIFKATERTKFIILRYTKSLISLFRRGTLFSIAIHLKMLKQCFIQIELSIIGFLIRNNMIL